MNALLPVGPAQNANNLDSAHQRDFFLCTASHYSLKGDQATMEAPIFSLSTQRDLKIWHWSSADGRKMLEVVPSVYGRATMRDKDLLIYATSHLIAGMNSGFAPQRIVRFVAYDFLVATNRGTRGDDYREFRNSLDRLKGTTLKTNIVSGGKRITKAFSLIESYEIVERGPTESRMSAIEITLSTWLFEAIQAMEVLTLNPSYFQLRKSLERRLYEIARKHVGMQDMWLIGLDTLAKKCGCTASRLRKFRESIRQISHENRLPDYRVDLLDGVKVLFSRR